MPKRLEPKVPELREKDVVFLNVLRVGIMVIFAVWITEYSVGLVQFFDHIGYGASVFFTLFAYILSRFFKQTRLAKSLIFIYVVIYLLTLAVLAFWHAAKIGELYPIASTLQWLPIIYIIAFLFLEKRMAIVGVLTVYFILITLLFLTYTDLIPVPNPDLQMLLVNMGLSHSLYIVCMYAVMRLRLNNRKQAIIANQMEREANVDSLLNIANRRYLQSMMDVYMNNGDSVSLLLVDVDHFKTINDKFGHASGDKVLKQVVKHIVAMLRPVDVVGRWGGEEFLILADVGAEDDAVSLAERIRASVERHLQDHTPPVTISIGVAEYLGTGDIEEQLNHADRALYFAKEKGRNQVALFNSTLQLAQ